jgi:hypothetical protein
VTQDIEMRFVCTRIGEHPSRELFLITLAPDRGQGSNAVENAMERLSPGVLRDGRRIGGKVANQSEPIVLRPSGEPIPVWPMKCPKCGWQRDFPYANLVALIEKLHGHGIVSVDISALPANLSFS